MQEDNYKQNLKEALRNLIKINDSIYQSLIDLSMPQGELKQWNDSVPIGEVHNFSFELFQNSSDTNIQLLVKLITNVVATINSIQNLNSIVLDDDEYIDPDINPEELLF